MRSSRNLYNTKTLKQIKLINNYFRLVKREFGETYNLKDVRKYLYKKGYYNDLLKSYKRIKSLIDV